MLQTVTFLRLHEHNTEFAIEKYIAHDIKLKNKIKNLRCFKIVFFMWDFLGYCSLYSARHLNPTFLYGDFFNLNEVTRAK